MHDGRPDSAALSRPEVGGAFEGRETPKQRVGKQRSANLALAELLLRMMSQTGQTRLGSSCRTWNLIASPDIREGHQRPDRGGARHRGLRGAGGVRPAGGAAQPAGDARHGERSRSQLLFS